MTTEASFWQEQARFISRDPLTAVTRSAYGYVHGNPLNRVDPGGAYDPSQVYCAISSATDCSNDPLKEVQDTCADDPDGCANDLENLNASIRAQVELCDPRNPALHLKQAAYFRKLLAARAHATQRLQAFAHEGGGVNLGATAIAALKCGIGGGISAIFTAITGGAGAEVFGAAAVGCGAAFADIPIDDIG